jgi:aspartate carbamoyltransferase catalytic subunit
MKLRKWLKTNDYTARQFGPMVGWSESKVSRILNGQTPPDLDDLKAVAAATDGLVQPNDWLQDDPPADEATMLSPAPSPVAVPLERFPHRHLLGIEGLSPDEITTLLDLAESHVTQNRRPDKKLATLRGRTVMNLFFESSTRTRTSFELAGKRLGADVVNMQVEGSSIKKGETLVDMAMTLNAMRLDMLVVRHPAAGAVALLAQKVDCSVLNAGDGAHEHPTQALLDALTIRRRKGRLKGLVIAICGDISHSRVARSNIALLNCMGARVRVVAPPTLLPAAVERLGVEAHDDMLQGLADCDIVMMLRLQSERMQGAYVPSLREYFRFYGLDEDKLAAAKPDALVMHPGPMNRGVEIDTTIADDINRSAIAEQVEMGVAVRMACLESLTLGSAGLA